MLIDKAIIYLTAGNGGHGGMSFRREKYEPNGGPDGGNGGKGGDIILKADKSLRTLLPFKYRKKYKAENGLNGTSKKSTGKSGNDLVINVPVGTVIFDKQTNKPIYDLKEDQEEFIAAKGGRGGRGNMNFASSTRQAPRFAQGGEKGQEKILELELKMLADVGLLGFPNVGKSTFLSRVSAAKPKIANYHFTTIEPNLGVLDYKNYDSFVIADIPGIIEGAHEGTGLGLQFLRHIERTKMLIHFVDISGSENRDPIEDFKTINNELLKYNEKLAGRKQIIALNKTDLLNDDELLEMLQKEFEDLGYETFPISAVTGEGLDKLISRCIQLLDEIGEVEPIFDIEPEVEYTFEEQNDEAFKIHIENTRDGKVYVVDGDFERLLNSVNFDDLDSIGYFQRKLNDQGLFKELKKMEIQEGDLVRINDIEFDYFE